MQSSQAVPILRSETPQAQSATRQRNEIARVFICVVAFPYARDLKPLSCYGPPLPASGVRMESKRAHTFIAGACCG